jgi:maltose alpha-D-glucosyltransferase/alpha-amylase
VENQRRDAGSLLNWMTTLIRLRKECPEIGYGDWEIMETGYREILGMRYSWKDKVLLIWHNFSEKSLELIVPERQAGTGRLIDLMNNIESVLDHKGRHTITLEAYGYRWFRAQV